MWRGRRLRRRDLDALHSCGRITTTDGTGDRMRTAVIAMGRLTASKTSTFGRCVRGHFRGQFGGIKIIHCQSSTRGRITHHKHCGRGTFGTAI